MSAQQPLSTFGLDGPMSSAAVSPDGHYIGVNIGSSLQKADGSWDSTEFLEVLDSTSSTVVTKINMQNAALLKNMPPSSADAFVAYCDGGRYLVAYDEISTLYIVDTRSYKVESTINLGRLREIGPSEVSRVMMTCSASGNLIAVNAYGGQFGGGFVRLFDLTSGKQVAGLRQDASLGTQFGAISLSPSGSKLAILLKDPKWKSIKGPNVEIRETQGLKLLSSFSTGDAPRGLGFAGESEAVTVQEQPAGWSPPKQALRLWNVESGKEERRFSDAHLDVDGPISSSADGKYVAASITKYHECRLCNGLEGRRDVTEQRFAVWNKATGAQIYRSEPYRPIVEPLGPEPVLSQSGGVVMVYWPDNVITPRLFPVP
jgi:WD40 repeat protein